MWEQGKHGKSLYLPFDLAVNLKLLKNSLKFKKKDHDDYG